MGPGVSYDVGTLFLLSFFVCLVGILIFREERYALDLTGGISKPAIFCGGILWLSPLIVESVLLLLYPYLRGDTLAGDGFADVLVYYGLLSTFTIQFYPIVSRLMKRVFRWSNVAIEEEILDQVK